MDTSAKPPKVRPVTDVDFTKAKPSCKHCHGRGYTGFMHVKQQDGADASVRVLCGCVVKRGGVTQRMPELDGKRLAAGLAQQVRQMAPDARARLMASLQASAADTTKDETVRKAIATAIDELSAEPAQEGEHVDPNL